MKKLKKPLSILLLLIMIFSLFTIVPFTANAAEGVYYKYGEWDESNHRLLTVYTSCSDYTVLDSNSTTVTYGTRGDIIYFDKKDIAATN